MTEVVASGKSEVKPDVTVTFVHRAWSNSTGTQGASRPEPVLQTLEFTLPVPTGVKGASTVTFHGKAELAPMPINGSDTSRSQAPQFQAPPCQHRRAPCTCTLPFTYNNVTYSECTAVDAPVPWCPTSLEPGAGQSNPHPTLNMISQFS